MSKVKADAFGDFNLGALSQACNTKEANEVTVRTWLAKATHRKSTLVFCVDMAHVRDLAKAFRDRGVDARYVLGSDRVDERSAKLDDFKQNRFPVMLNCGVFTEGTDIPNIDCVLLARPTRSRNLLVQMIGRGMRLHPDKQDCHIIDMVASLSTGIITTPSLFGLDPDHVLENATVKDLKSRSTSDNILGGAQRGAPISKVTFTEYDSVQDLLKNQSEDRHIRTLSQNAWVNIGDERHVLANRQGEYLTIEPHKPVTHPRMFQVRFNEKIPVFAVQGKWRPLKRANVIALAENFEAAVRAADTFAASKDSFERRMTTANASWRNAPCTAEQLAFLNRTIGKSHALGEYDVTKGQAADMITKIKFGARGRFEKILSNQRRVQREEDRVERLRQREEVAVGPVPV